MGEGDPVGGSLTVVGLLEEYGEALEVDFITHYPGRDITEVVTGEMSPRRAFNLINRLPPGSVFQALRGGGEEFVGWTPDRLYLAQLLETQIFHRFEYLVSNADKKDRGKLKEPEPLDLPGRKPAKPKNPFVVMLEKARAARATNPATE